MQPAAPASEQGYQELASYFRSNPRAIEESPEELARRFGLHPDQVRQILAAAHQRGRKVVGPKRDFWAPFAHAFQVIIDNFRLATKNPVRFVAGTSIALVVYLEIASRIPALKQAEILLKLLLYGVPVIAVFTLQMACFGIHGRVRVPLLGGLANWIIVTTTLVITQWIEDRLSTDPNKLMIALLGTTFGMFMLMTLYTGIGATISIVGGFLRMRKEERSRENLSRQQMLERIFHLEEQLKSPVAAEGPRYFLDNPFFSWLRKNALWVGLAVGAVASVVQYMFALGFGLRDFSPESIDEKTLVAVVVIGLMSLGSYFVAVFVGFLSGTLWRSMLVGALYTLGSFISMVLPNSPFKFEDYSQQWVGTVITMLGFFIAGMGAAVERRAALDRRRRSNDPAVLLSELIELRYRLNPDVSNVCVMVVDAARSSDMKAAADPLVVEYSFREYQAMIQDITEQHEGRIHSTAGDGAISVFPTCDLAFAAARKVQSEIEHFNMKVNRLKTPFRLRIGLHTGAVQGQLEKVEFNEVIDIAAHVQGVSQIGGIAMTEAVAEAVKESALIPLKDPVDGQNVFIAYDPKDQK